MMASAPPCRISVFQASTHIHQSRQGPSDVEEWRIGVQMGVNMSGLRSTVIKSNRIKKVINNAQKIFSAELSVTRYLLQGKNQF